jgi:ParB-like chromosome segregation protein Spo0J
LAEEEIAAILQRIDKRLSVLVAIVLDQYLREVAAKPKERSAEQVLADAGLTHQQIADLLGKTRQAVSQGLKARQGK